MMQPTTVLIFCSLCLAAFVACQGWTKARGGLQFTACTNDRSRLLNILLHISGILTLGMIPFLLQRNINYPIHWWKIPEVSPGNAVLTGSLCLVAALLAYREAARMNRNANRGERPDLKLVYFYFPVRIAYITAYEYYFRGILFFGCLMIMHVLWAVVLNTSFYLIAHLLGDKKEITGTLVMGPLLCLCCFTSGSFWPAVAIHLSLTLFYEINHIRFSYTSIKMGS